MPMMTITTSNSINVNPFFIVKNLLNRYETSYNGFTD
jgi:hypothetical protein